MRARALVAIALSACLAPALGACRSAGHREAASLAEAVARFHRADNANKPTAAEGIRAVGCTAEDVCRARDACLASADATAKALRLKSEVEAGLAALEKGTLEKDAGAALALPEKLDEAEALLKEGHERLPACDEAVAALKRTYGL